MDGAARIKLLLAVGAALWLVGRSLPAALLFLFPSLLRVRETEDDGSLDPRNEPAVERIHEGLLALGFAKLGAIQVNAPLASPQAELVYGAPSLRTFADLNGRGGSLQLTLFTPFEGGEAVGTSNFQRPGRNDPDLLLGGLPGHEVASLWAAHKRRIAELADAPGRSPWRDVTLAGRVTAEIRFYRGAGRRLLRSRGLVPLLMLVMALLFAALAAVQFLRLR